MTKIAILQAGTPASSLAQEPDLGYRRIHDEVSLLSYKAYRLTTLGRRGAIATHQRKTLAEDLPVILLSPGSSHRASLLAVCPLKAQKCDDEHNCRVTHDTDRAIRSRYSFLGAGQETLSRVVPEPYRPVTYLLIGNNPVSLARALAHWMLGPARETVCTVLLGRIARDPSTYSANE